VDLRDPANEHRIAVLSQGAYGPKVGVPLLLDLLDKNDLTTSWFIPGWTAERWPDVVADIHDRGHEIRHHGYLHEGLEGRSRDEEEEEILEKTSRILAGITGKGPIGYRAPLFEITHETVGLLRKHGFTYASNLQDSLWPYAYPGAPPLVELPVQWMLDGGPYFAYGLRPPLYRQIFPPSAVLSIWKEEFRAMYELGGALTLTLHPQYSGRPSRVKMLQDLVRYMRTLPGVWFTHGAEVARYAASEAAGIGTDGRPRPSPVGSRNGRPRRSPARRR
jgi:peptidoglycan-N-acetylglucosamine deacetylase